MRTVPILAAAAALALAGCGSSSSSTTATRAATRAATATSGGCTKVATPAARPIQHIPAPTVKLDPAKTYTVDVTTNCGSFAFTLDVKTAPKTAASIYYLVKRGFYDDLTFHRVAAGFVIQGGDPQGNGTGGPGYTVVEPPPSSTQYVEGTVAMAKSGAQPSGASGSQFFIVTAANATTSAGLTPVYALVGKVVSGMSTVLRIDALPTSPSGDGYPTPAVVMSSVTVTTS
jgi:peptidyl-prolyl cis-trans isomerase B (cyclophilin B)